MIVKLPEQAVPAAPEGSHPAVCVDELDLGKVTNTYNGEERTRHMVRLVWQIDEDMDDATAQKFNMPRGSRYIVKQDYTASLDEKAKLRAHLKSWRGQDFTFDELVGFDLENIVGKPCLLGVTHNTGRKGGTFANVTAVMKLPRGIDPITPLNYVRVKDRAKVAPVAFVAQPAPAPVPAEEQPPFSDGISDDDVPF